MRNNHIYNYLHIVEEDDGKGGMIEAFSINLRKLRTDKKLTQEQLGTLANINYKYLGELERNIKSASGIVIYKLSRALGVPVCELLSTDGCPHAKGELFKEVERLFKGKGQEDVEKAIRILEVFFG